MSREELIAAIRQLLQEGQKKQEGEGLDGLLARFQVLLDAWDSGQPVPQEVRP